jgi:UDP-glucose:(heptosyl)LPS alpha-1,3-glucosyltransferase
MKFAFCLFKYFPYGGLQRDFLQIAEACLFRGHEIDVYTSSWAGDRPDTFNIFILPRKGQTNHRRYQYFAAELARQTTSRNYDAVVGFNKMPGLDIYFAADVCYRAQSLERSYLYRLSPRCRALMALERAVFDKDAHTRILSISNTEKKRYIDYYDTPAERFYPVPPGIPKNRIPTVNTTAGHDPIRREFTIPENTFLVLMVGSDYKRKGVDRAIRAIAALSAPLKEKTRLIIVGKGHKWPYFLLAKRLKVSSQVDFLGERDDVPRLMAGADIFLHPAYHELAGMALIEALSAGLPVLATDTCGCAYHVTQADAGKLTPSPFRQETLNSMLASMLADGEKRKQWKANARTYAATADIYNMHAKLADIIETIAATTDGGLRRS